MIDEHERTMVNESRAMQDTLLHVKFERWKMEDKVVFWRVVAVLGWLGAFAFWWLAIWMVNHFNGNEHRTKTGGGSGGTSLFQVPMWSAVGAVDPALRGDSMPVQSLGVGAASETRWTVGGLSASRLPAGNGGRDNDLTGRGGSSGDHSCPTSLPRRPATFEGIRRGLKSGMDADEGAAVHGWAAAPIGKGSEWIC